MSRRWRIIGGGLGWAFVVLALSGCGETPAVVSYVPAPEAARGALVAMLEQWRRGEGVEVPLKGKPAVQVSDHERKAGQALAGYEVLGEVAAEKARAYAVRLRLEGPEELVVARFVVVGVDPIWVFRQEDFERLLHWDHKMDEPGKTP